MTLQGRGDLPPLFVIHGGSGEVFIHVELARRLAPDRPVHGLIAIGFDGHGTRQRSVEEMAAHYADEILRFQPQGPYHLLGYSAGGWYAWAVAAELQRRGADVGLVSMVDSGTSADLHRRVRLPLLLNRLVRTFPSRLQELHHQELGLWVRQRSSALKYHLQGLQRRKASDALPTATLPPEERTVNPTRPVRSDFFILLQQFHRPARLPLKVEVFTSQSSDHQARRIWRFYARRGVRTFPILTSHLDMFHKAKIPKLAEQLKSRLATADEEHSHRITRS